MPTQTFYNLPKNKKKNIENVAIKLINDLGYDKTTVSDIVKACQIPRGSFYQYFDNKFDLFSYLLESKQQEEMTFIKPLYEDLAGEAFIDLFKDFVQASLDFARQHLDVYQLGFQLYQTHDETVNDMRQHMEEKKLDIYRDLLTQDVENGYLKAGVNVDVLAKLLYAFNVKELYHLIYEGGTDREILDLTTCMIDIIKYGVKKEGS